VKSLFPTLAAPYSAMYDTIKNTIIVPEYIWVAYKKKDPQAVALLEHEYTHSKSKKIRLLPEEERRAYKRQLKFMEPLERSFLSARLENILESYPKVYYIPTNVFRKMLSSPKYREKTINQYYRKQFKKIYPKLTAEKYEMLLRGLRSAHKKHKIKQIAREIYTEFEKKFPRIHQEMKSIAKKKSLGEALLHLHRRLGTL
jgi:hypothetical protein